MVAERGFTQALPSDYLSLGGWTVGVRSPGLGDGCWGVWPCQRRKCTSYRLPNYGTYAASGTWMILAQFNC